MKNSLIQVALRSLIAPILEKPVRSGSLKAVKAYVQTVQVARMALMGLFGVGAFMAILVAGIFFLIFGGVGMLPIEPRTMAMIMLITGAVLAVVGGIALAMILSQRRWLEMSRSYDLMEAALAPWPNSVPPDPRDVLKGKGPKLYNKRDRSTINAPMVGNEPATLAPLMTPEIPYLPDPDRFPDRRERRQEPAPQILH
ncbi:MAG TPA: phage holin family protein [Bdellovibrionales bacterium]|nr:phage holin family protein [Bdellovibrionales bacterium]